MKKQLLCRLSLISVAIVLLLSACEADNSETLVLPKPVTSIDDVIPIELQEQMNSHGMTIYKGDNPPNVEGAYIVKPVEVVFCSDSEYAPGTIMSNDMLFKFTNQNGQKLSCEMYIDGGSYSSNNVRISGNGDYFTAYFTIVGTTEDFKIQSKLAVIISGKKIVSGIQDVRCNFTMLEKNDPDDKMMEINTFRIFKDSDGLASNTTWKGLGKISVYDEMLNSSPVSSNKSENANAAQSILMKGDKQ